MRKLKILFIANNNIGFGLSGGDTIFIQLLSHWCRQSRLTLLACQEAIDILPHKISPLITIKTDTTNPNPQNTVLNLFLHYLRRISKVFVAIHKNYRPLINQDIVYSVSDFLPDLLPAVYLKIVNPHIKWITGYYLFAPTPWSSNSPYRGLLRFKGLIYWLIQKLTVPIVDRYANLIFVTSRPDTLRFRHPNRVIVVQGGVDIRNIKKYLKHHPLLPTTKRKYDACYLGRFHPQKGVLELIDIWKIVTSTHPRAKLAIIGKGELEKQTRAKILKLKLTRNIDLFGFRSGTTKYNIFRQSKIVVHPATYDSGGMAAAEAMAFGLPGVSFALESLKTYYPQGMLKSRCFNLNHFAQNIIRLLDNPKLYRQTSKDAQMLIFTQWDWAQKSTRLLGLINHL